MERHGAREKIFLDLVHVEVSVRVHPEYEHLGRAIALSLVEDILLQKKLTSFFWSEEVLFILELSKSTHTKRNIIVRSVLHKQET